MLVFEKRGNAGCPERKKPLKQSREPTTNSTHILRWVWEAKPGHIGGRRALRQLRHPMTHNAIAMYSLLGNFIYTVQDFSVLHKPSFPHSYNFAANLISISCLFHLKAKEKYRNMTTVFIH